MSASQDMPGADIDPEIKEIFVEEAREVLSTLEEYFPVWCHDVDNKDALAETRRAFHTLKGSGRMVSAEAIGELAWSVENMLNRVIDGRIQPDSTLLSVIDDVIALVPSMVTAYDAGNLEYDQDKEASLRDVATRLANGEAVAWPAEEVAAETVQEEVAEEEVDPDLLEIFVIEARNHLAALQAFIADQRDKAPFFEPPTSALQTALHTLKGSAHMANIQAVAQLATPLEKFVKELLNYQIPLNGDAVELLADCQQYGESIVSALDKGSVVETAGLDALVSRLAECREQVLEPVLGQGAEMAKVDPAFLNMIMAEGMQSVLDAEKTLAAWQANKQFDRSVLATMATELSELRSGAEKAGFPALAELSGAISGT